MKSDVNFDKVNFRAYVRLQDTLRELTNTQADELKYDLNREILIDEVKKELKDYETNINNFFNVISGKYGMKFGIKAHHELKDRRYDPKFDDLKESYFIPRVTEQEEVSESFWRYEEGRMCTIKHGVRSKKHPFIEGDRVETICFISGKNGEHQYEVKHESSNDDTTFIVNDNELV